jgi:hypothetical protein
MRGHCHGEHWDGAHSTGNGYNPTHAHGFFLYSQDHITALQSPSGNFITKLFLLKVLISLLFFPTVTYHLGLLQSLKNCFVVVLNKYP